MWGILLILVTLFCVSDTLAAAQTTETQAALTAAAANPDDNDAIRRLTNVLPKVTLPNGVVTYVIEGDIRRTPEQLQWYLYGLKDRQSKPLPTKPELLVNLKDDGELDYLKTLQSRRLSYSVDRASFTKAEYNLLVKNMTAAAKDWTDICPLCQIRFEYRPKFDSAPSTLNTSFVVQKTDSRGAFIASSFFPSDDPAQHLLLIDPSYFSPTLEFNQVGVLRHEIGHILGYRHEHIQGIPGCAMEDGNWKRLTEYTPHSVMHYMCGDGGSLDLKFRDVDIQGHRCLYDEQFAQQFPMRCSPTAAMLSTDATAAAQLIAPPESPRGQALRIRFHGGKIADNLIRVLNLLLDNKTLAPVTYTTEQGDYTCLIYKKVMDWPAKLLCPQSLLELAAKLNRTDIESMNHLTVGKKIRVIPHLDIRPYLRSASPKQGNEIWKIPSLLDDHAEVIYYELWLPMNNEGLIRKLSATINEWRNPFIVSAVDLGGDRLPPLHASRNIAPNDFIKECREGNGKTDVNAWYAKLISTAGLPACAMVCPGDGCAEVMLLDAVVLPHPNLKGAIAYPQLSFGTTSQCTEVEEATNKTYHGTMMAGIIGARPDQHPFVGVAPSSLIYSLDLKGKYNFDVGDLLHRWRGPRRVFVMATSYPTGGLTRADKKTLKNPDDRINRAGIGETVAMDRPLLITAVGQPEADTPFSETSEIRKDSDLSPMDMGDRENVVVVTACEDCTDDNARLLSSVHYSLTDRLVHIAAPGHDIPALGSSEQLIHSVGGTSPATAFVAGVAAAMINCFPRSYTEPFMVKSRLQLTARPVLKDEDADKVQSGVLDGDLALKDPSLTYLKRTNSPKYEPVKIAAWCTTSLTITDPLSRQEVAYGRTDLNKLLRLYRLRTVSSDGDQYVVFKVPPRAWGKKEWDTWIRGAMMHTPPGLPSITGNLLKLDNGDPVAIGQIDDLILSAPVEEVAPC